jgi:hypothetical protein
MKSMKYILFISLCTALLLFAGCDSATSPPAFQDGNTGNNTGGPACKAMVAGSLMSEIREELKHIRRDAEAYMHELSDQFPDFGGIYLDEEGRYNILMTDMENEAGVRASVLSSDQAKVRSGGENRDVTVRIAEYRFRDLAVWRELATAFLLAGNDFHYVLSTQVHEAKNRVAVGIDARYWDDVYLKEVKNYMTATLEIPINAVLFEKEYAEVEEDEGEDEDFFGTLSGDTFERQRPILGGLRIRYSSSNCSMGFLGEYDGEEVFVTNGHCTDNAHGRSATLYFQGERDEPNDVVGTEIADGPQSLDKCVTSNSDCWPCRWSDSALVGIREDVERARGFIAKTEWKSETWAVEGSRQIDVEEPVFTIVDLKEDIMTGMTLHKVGGNSGWTSGEVIRTCVDSRRTRHELILQCQFRARYASSGGGTSGSPVFKRLEGEFENIDHPVTLVGIHWASSNRDQSNGYTVFSPVDGILKDFEGLEGLAIETETDD